MLDVNDFIVERGGNPGRIKESQRRRYAPVEIVDEVIALWEDHRKTNYAATQIKAQINAVQKEIGLKKKAKEDAAELIQKKADLDKEHKQTLDSAAEKEKILKEKVSVIGNIVHESVPVSDNEDNNKIERIWPPDSKPEKKDVLSHHEVLTRLDGYEPERGVKTAGHRGYYMKNWGLKLHDALYNYARDFLEERGFNLLAPPEFMNKDQMAKTAQLSQFDEELYKVVQDGDPNNDKYLIATSEQPLSVFNADEWIHPTEVPLKYAGFSSCFRKEAGSHGRDAWGIFRVHQFKKAEQFVLTDPEKSWEMFDEMIGNAEAFYQSLGLPYQIVSIVSGALNNAAAKKYDLEAWFPHQGEYKELVSCSNCTDYQSRSLEIRFGQKKQTDARKIYVHALNSTLCAITRALCCILENYQTEEGLNVPEPLRDYIKGRPEFIPFTKERPKMEALPTRGKQEAKPAAKVDAKK